MKRFLLVLSVGTLATELSIGCSALTGETRSDDCANWSTCEPDSSATEGGAVDGSRVDGQSDAYADGTADVGDAPIEDGGTDVGKIDAGDAFVCDPTKSPSDEPCVIAEAYGIFVSPSGDDTNAGTRTAPVKTVAHALTIAGAKRIYVCNAEYGETLSIASSTANVSIYGGLECPSATDAGTSDASVKAWSYVPGTSASWTVASARYALRIDGVSKSMHLEDLTFTVGDGVAAGESSIAAFISSSADVSLTRVGLAAGAGVAGAPGVTPSTALPVASNGSNAGAATPCVCANGVTSTGGKGGVTNGGGDPGQPILGGGFGGTGGAICGNGGKGGTGADGAAAAAVTSGSTVGTIDANGWTPSGGAVGGIGATAQGGGGGNSLDVAGIGGGGACGGCGGAPASAPTGGGASVALMVLDSKVAVNQSKLVTKDAGPGGAGAVGQTGAAGGTGGVDTGPGCLGGAGGKGGDGAASSGGAGGISVGVLYKSATAPVIDAATKTTVGNPGAKGAGGAASNSGPAGVSVAELQP